MIADPTPRDRRTSSHPTRELLLSTVITLLDDREPDDLTVALVLETSGVSLGSLYHHFEDFGDLVDQGLAQRYRRYVDDTLAAVDHLMESTTTREQARQGVAAAHREIHQPDRRPFRLERASIISRSIGHPELAAAIAEAQGELTSRWARHVSAGQARGWLRTDVDPTATAILIQALTLGRVVDDVVVDHVDPDAWVDASLLAIDHLLFGD